MPVTSAVDLVNIALSKLGQQPIMSLDDAKPSARAARARYEDVRDRVLRKDLWKCALKRAALAESAIAPAFGFARRFSLPSDFIRLAGTDDFLKRARIEGGFILTNDGDCNIRYVRRMETVADMDDLLKQVIAAELAAELALTLTGDQKKKDALAQEAVHLIEEARYIDAIETPTVDTHEPYSWTGAMQGHNDRPTAFGGYDP